MESIIRILEGMLTRVFYILTIMISALICCSESKLSDHVLIDEIPDESMDFQKMLIAKLTGHEMISLSDGASVKLESRWTPEERKRSISYLSAVIESLGEEPLVHAYRHANINFGVDLLIEPFRGWNLYTILESTEQSDEYVIMGAHYDTGGDKVPGAIDNASGVALVMAVFKAMKARDHRSRNLVFVFFDQEEEELIGSSAFAGLVRECGWNVHSVHTFDMVGWDGDNNREVELEMPSEAIEELYIRNAGELGIPIYSTNINSSDHYSFIKMGFDAVGISQAYAKRDNSGKKDTPEDMYHLVNFDYLASTMQLVERVMKELTE